MRDKCLFQIQSSSFSQENALPIRSLQTSDFLENMLFYRVMAQICLLDDQEPEPEERVDEPIRYVLQHSL